MLLLSEQFLYNHIGSIMLLEDMRKEIFTLMCNDTLAPIVKDEIMRFAGVVGGLLRCIKELDITLMYGINDSKMVALYNYIFEKSEEYRIAVSNLLLQNIKATMKFIAIICIFNKQINENIAIFERLTFEDKLHESINKLSIITESERANLNKIANNSDSIEVIDSSQYPNTPITVLLNALQYNNNVEVLKLHGIKQEEFQKVLRLFEKNSIIHTLDLRGCDINDQDALELGIILSKNDTLRLLNLSHNNIGNVGAIAIGAGLRSKSKLAELYLENNNGIAESGASSLYHAFVMSSSLLKLKYSAGKEAINIFNKFIYCDSMVTIVCKIIISEDSLSSCSCELSRVEEQNMLYRRITADIIKTILTNIKSKKSIKTCKSGMTYTTKDSNEIIVMDCARRAKIPNIFFPVVYKFFKYLHEQCAVSKLNTIEIPEALITEINTAIYNAKNEHNILPLFNHNKTQILQSQQEQLNRSSLKNKKHDSYK